MASPTSPARAAKRAGTSSSASATSAPGARRKLYAFTIVHRSFPGVTTPFVDAVVDLDDGAHLKGTLLDVEPDPEKIPFDLPVRIVYREATPINAKGKPYLTYYFVPA
jgi:uncharacterized OB-fold protein